MPGCQAGVPFRQTGVTGSRVLSGTKEISMDDFYKENILDHYRNPRNTGSLGRGCAISQASASMLTEMLQGKTLEAAKAISKEDILDALGIEIGPVRMKCALLSLKVLKAGAYGLSEEDWNTDDDDW
jgi:nitrogen fixation NifU-like protein